MMLVDAKDRFLWRMAYVCLNNPGTIPERVKHLSKEEMKMLKDIMSEIVNG